MKFCCHAANGRFDDRLNVGEFLIAGVDPDRGELREWGQCLILVIFLRGHRWGPLDVVIPAIRFL